MYKNVLFFAFQRLRNHPECNEQQTEFEKGGNGEDAINKNKTNLYVYIYIYVNMYIPRPPQSVERVRLQPNPAFQNPSPSSKASAQAAQDDPCLQQPSPG